MALENEEKAKKKIIQELEGEKHSLLRIQKEQKKAMDVMINEKELKKKRDQLKEELRNKKNELKEKQNLLRKQEKQMKEQHEALITLEEKCRKLQTLVYEKKAGLSSNSAEAKTEDDVRVLEAEIKELERTQMEEKKKYKQMITTQENKIKELSLQIETLNLELKQKDQECRLNTLKINELKRQLRMGAMKPANEPAATQSKQSASKVSKDVEQIKRDMKAEKDHTMTPEEKSAAGSSIQGHTPAEVVAAAIAENGKNGHETPAAATEAKNEAKTEGQPTLAAVLKEQPKENAKEAPVKEPVAEPKKKEPEAKKTAEPAEVKKEVVEPKKEAPENKPEMKKAEEAPAPAPGG